MSSSRQRMFGRQQEEGDPPQGVRPGGEDGHLPARLSYMEYHLASLGAPDPVTLHGEHALGPAGKLVHVRKETLGVIGDAQEPLTQGLLLNQGVAAFASAVDHLFVGEDGAARRAPVGASLGLVRQFLFVKPQEQPLRPLVVIGGTGRQFAVPVVGISQSLQPLLEQGDVVPGILGGMDTRPYGRILRRQSESVPSHGMEYVHAFTPQVARQHIPEVVVGHVPDVGRTGGIREHHQDVLLLAPRLLARAVEVGLLPASPPFLLDRFKLVFLFHGLSDDPYPTSVSILWESVLPSRRLMAKVDYAPVPCK